MRNALTFIELLFVIAIIGIFIALVTPQFRRTFDDFELENFAKDIYYLSRYLQASAITQGKVYCLNINPSEGTFQATYKAGSEFKAAEGRFGRVYKAPQGINVEIEDKNQAENTEIYFYPDGSSDDGSSANLTVKFENRHKRKVSLSIQGETGVIKIQ